METKICLKCKSYDYPGKTFNVVIPAEVSVEGKPVDLTHLVIDAIERMFICNNKSNE